MSPVGDKYVCSECFQDYAIRDFIQSRAISKICSYCGRRRKRPIAAEIDDVVEKINEGIEHEYEDAVQNVSYDSSEGGYLLSTDDTYELVHNIFEDEDLGEELKNDVCRGLPDSAWVQKNPYSLTDAELWKMHWMTFVQQIKHESRYVFFKLPRTKTLDRESLAKPFNILFHLGKIVDDLGLVRTLPVGETFYRVRCRSAVKKYKTAEELGPPPAASAIYSNRMSPAGIPMFYGAKDIKTAVRETWDPLKFPKRIVTVAKFRTLKKMDVLDLTNLPQFPNLFDDERRHMRPAFSFLRSFITDSVKPIAKDGREHIDYVPTQVVTEFFRLIFRGSGRTRLQGIFYPSSKNPGGKSCVLFFESHNCRGVKKPAGRDSKKWLELLPNSIKRLRTSGILKSGKI